MARTIRFSQVLWLLTTAWLVACGRLSFDPLLGGGPTGDTPPDMAMDASTATDALIAVQLDAPAGLDAAIPIDAAVPPPIDSPAPAPVVSVASNLALTAVCGANPVGQSLVVQNTGNADLIINNASASDSFQVTPSTTQIAPGDSATFTVDPPVAIIGEHRDGQTMPGTLTLDTNAGPHAVSLSALVKGANIDNSVTTPPLLLRALDGSCPAQNVTLTNHGTSSVQLNGFGTDLALTGISGVTIAPAATRAITIRPTICTGASSTFDTSISFAANSGNSTASALCDAPQIDVTIQVAFNSTGGCACS